MLVADEQHETRRQCGSIAQLGEHLPYKQGVTGSSPVVPTTFFGPVVQLVRTLACHARGRRFEPDPGRQNLPLQLSRQSRGLKIPVSVVRFRPEAPIKCGCSSSGRAPPCQGGGSGFEPRHPLQYPKHHMGAFSFVIFYLQLHILYHKALQPSGKAGVCKTPIPQFKSE